MNIVCYYLTYNRPQILKESFFSSLNNTEITPKEIWIIDDGSEAKLKSALLDYSNEYSPKGTPINLLIHGNNYGIGYSFERLYNLIRQNDDLDIACILESDYIWRKDWLKVVIDVFDASPNTLAIAGTDHPDMYDVSKTHSTFPDIMKECFGEDLKSRNYLYIPFDLQTSSGKIQVQGVSNSCGCTMIHWKRLKKVIKKLEDSKKIPYNDFWNRMDRAFNKGVSHDTRKNASDGWMSSTISKYGEMYLELENLDLKTNFPFLSICDYSISEHICGGGVNGLIVPEGRTFVHSPKCDSKFLLENPRKNNYEQ